eukprot:1381065-Amphidinium_carterae.1
MENRKKRKKISARTRHMHHKIEQCQKETQRRQPENTSYVVEVSDATDDSLPLSALKNVDAKKIASQKTAKKEIPSALETSPQRKKK